MGWGLWGEGKNDSSDDDNDNKDAVRHTHIDCCSTCWRPVHTECIRHNVMSA